MEYNGIEDTYLNTDKKNTITPEGSIEMSSDSARQAKGSERNPYQVRIIKTHPFVIVDDQTVI